MVHAQAAHMVSIYEIGNEESNHHLNGSITNGNGNVGGTGSGTGVSTGGAQPGIAAIVDLKLLESVQNQITTQQHLQQQLQQQQQLQLQLLQQQQPESSGCASAGSNSSTSDTEHTIELNGLVSSPDGSISKEVCAHCQRQF